MSKNGTSYKTYKHIKGKNTQEFVCQILDYSQGMRITYKLEFILHCLYFSFFTCFYKKSRLNPDFSDKNGITLQPWCCLTHPFIPVNKQPTLSSASIFGITIVDFTIGINIHCNFGIKIKSSFSPWWQEQQSVGISQAGQTA